MSRGDTKRLKKRGREEGLEGAGEKGCLARHCRPNEKGTKKG